MNEMRGYLVAASWGAGAVTTAALGLSFSASAADAFASFRTLWTQDQEPFAIFANTYYVGTRGLSAILITSDQGHILLDGALPESATRIAGNIRTLGFDPRDVVLILNSHAHSDHAGGIAELQKLTGAEVAASVASATVLERGRAGPDDPQFEYGDSFPAVRDVRIVRDGETLQAGALKITVHYTPGHTPGSTSWTWESCESAQCLNMVYADSLTAVSDSSFRFSGDPRNPTALEEFRETLRTVESLPCDILLAPHPESVGLWDRRERRAAGDPRAFVDDNACRSYAAAARERLELRIKRERENPED